MSDPSSWMEAALELARKAAEEGEVPVGAVVVRDDEIIGRGHNTVERDGDATAHAELAALREASRIVGDWRLEETTLVSTLEPCPMCMGALLLARVGRLVYGAPDPRWGACGSATDLRETGLDDHLTEVRGGVRAEECGELLRGFFRELRGGGRGDRPGGSLDSDPESDA